MCPLRRNLIFRRVVLLVLQFQYPWEEVPLEGRPLSRKEIAQQRKDAKSRRHISRDAERLLRGVAQSTTWDGEASASQRCRSSLTIQHSTRTQWRIRSPAVDHSPVQNGFHRYIDMPGLRSVRRIR